ncbi:MAG TPA: patatin-like phospholipase family protein [Epulopiscium sp.]|nr:patatin-like phospholipase family protein [Candidatus Epulonipiscium sp.]
MLRQTFNILSIDGGGLRGVYAAAILSKIQEELGINYIEEFDLIAGTSTGAIIAAGLTVNVPPSTIVNIYKEQGSFIFKKPFWSGLITPKYDSTRLKQVLDEVFGDQTFSDVKTGLMVTATNVSDGMPWVFKSLYNERLKRDEGVKLADAVLASCSAPLYFNPFDHNEQLLADGGLWANNPALAALVEALGHNIDVKRYKIRLLSIGTGISVKHYPIEWIAKEWGATRWGIGLIDIIFNMQSFSIEKYLNTIMNKDHYVRINFEVDGSLAIDDIKTIDTLIEKGVNDFYNYRIKIKNLLEK